MKNKPRTLVILTPGFPSGEEDTACLPAQQVFVRALNRNYPELKVVLVSFEYPHRRDRYDWFGNTVIAIGGWKKGLMNKLKTCLTVWRLLPSLQRNNEVIGLLSFWAGGCALVGKYYARWHKLRHFTWILGQDARKGNRFIPLIRPAGDELVAMSNFLAHEFYRNYQIVPRHVIPNGVDPSLFDHATTGFESATAPLDPATRGFESARAGRDLDLLGVGSLISLKQYEVFVSVVQDLSKSLPGIRALLCGKGPEQDNLQRQIERLGLSDKIELVGEQPHRTAIGLMQRSRILLHPSNYEGFSTVCLEALFAGAHVISFCDPVGSPVKNWHVVNSKEEMAGKALALLQDPRTSFEPVRVYSMNDSAKAMMALFGYKPAATE